MEKKRPTVVATPASHAAPAPRCTPCVSTDAGCRKLAASTHAESAKTTNQR
jgi:hypothetical protein